MSDKSDILANADFAAKYLAQFGYLDVPSSKAGAQSLLGTDAVQKFQEFAGLEATGMLDAETLAKMQLPRCACPDVLSSNAELARWRKNRLTYFIEKRVSQIDAPTVDAQIREAFDDWEDAGDIKFTQVYSREKADLIISIGNGAADNFDGPGSTLAWAYLPNGSDGQLLMRFDATENWTVAGNGIRFRNVACHEFGHLIGLEHSRVQSALMAPFYSPAVVSPQANDDISRIVALYGPRVTTPPGGPPSNPDDPKTFCNLFKQLTASINTIRHAETFTMAGITFDAADKAALNQVLAAATSPTCGKITELLATLAKVCPVTPQPAIGGGLCANLSGVLALLPALQQLLAACKPTAA